MKGLKYVNGCASVVSKYLGKFKYWVNAIATRPYDSYCIPVIHLADDELDGAVNETKMNEVEI